MELGFRPANAVRVQFQLAEAGYSNEGAASFQRRLLAAAERLQGVEAVGYCQHHSAWHRPVHDGHHAHARQQRCAQPMSRLELTITTSPQVISEPRARFSSQAGISASLTAQRALLVALVNQEFARRLFHSDDVIGRYFKNLSGRPIQIVGVVANGKYTTLNEEPSPAIFFPIAQDGNTSTTLIVRTHPDPTGVTGSDMAAAINKTILDLDPAIPIQESSTWSSQLGLQLLPAQIATVALSLFGAFGLLLSITGTFGLASYSVTKRLRELSIRVALGAQAKQILTAALGRMLILLGIGSTAWAGAGRCSQPLLSAVVYQASAMDPIVLSAVAFTMLVTSLASIAKPVRRALHVDPASVLREQ